MMVHKKVDYLQLLKVLLLKLIDNLKLWHSTIMRYVAYFTLEKE